MSLTELISSKRDRAAERRFRGALPVELNKMGFSLDKVNLGASHLPQTLEAQMQQKMAAQQQAQQAEYELQKQEMLAKAAVAKAEGEAQSVLVRAKAESEANRMLQVHAQRHPDSEQDDREVERHTAAGDRRGDAAARSEQLQGQGLS